MSSVRPGIGMLPTIVSNKYSFSSSRRVQQRLNVQSRCVKLANMCISSLNRLSCSLSNSFSCNNNNNNSSSISARNPSSINNNTNNTNIINLSSIFHSFPSHQTSSSQLLSIQHVQGCASHFIRSRPDIECDPNSSNDTDHLRFSNDYLSIPVQDRLSIIASKVSLPEQPGVVDMLKVMPSSMAARYSSPTEMLRPDAEAIKLKMSRAKVQASRSEYVALIKRMMALGMLSFTATPQCVNGVFGVAKDEDKIRLIIDARPANSLFVEPDHVDLPSPDLIAQICVPTDNNLYVGKSDLDNFYHRLRLPEWMQPYFALPAVKCSEVGLQGGDCAIYPCCRTLPMGWSHSVLVAQAIHEHVVDSRSGLSKEDRVASMSSNFVLSHKRVLHLIYIDDVLFFGLDRASVDAAMAKYENAVTSVDFLVKQSKRVSATSDPVEGLGLEICGRSKRVGVSVAKLWKLCDATVALMRQRYCSGDDLRVLMGRWTWACMINRPTLAVFNAVYRYIEVAGSRNFRMWPVVRVELETIMGLAPLLFVKLCSPWCERVVATDASSTGLGVVACKVSRETVQAVAAGGVCGDQHVVDRFVQRQDWRVIVSSRWRDPEHINSLETRAVSTALRWLLSTRDPSVFGSKILLCSDSQVVVGALRKGRSPSRVLLRRIRNISSLLLASQLRLTVLWISTDINPADEPSRRH